MRREVFKTDFECPNCNRKYEDYDGNYLRRLNKSSTNRIVINCNCKNNFFLVITYQGYLKGVEIVKNRTTQRVTG